MLFTGEKVFHRFQIRYRLNCQAFTDRRLQLQCAEPSFYPIFFNGAVETGTFMNLLVDLNSPGSPNETFNDSPFEWVSFDSICHTRVYQRALPWLPRRMVNIQRFSCLRNVYRQKWLRRIWFHTPVVYRDPLIVSPESGTKKQLRFDD